MPTKKKTIGSSPTPKRRRQSSPRPTTTRGRVPEAADEPEIILAPDTILEHAQDLRPLYPNITDQHAHLAHLIVQTGWSVRKIAQTMNWSDSWAHSAIQREDLAEYLNRISMRALGWARAQAVGVATQLLSHKSPYIRSATAIDLMERGGLRAEPVRAAAQTFNFNVTLNGPGSGAAEPEVIDQMGPVVLMAQPEDALKSGLAVGGGSLPHAEGTQSTPSVASERERVSEAVVIEKDA